MILALDVSSTAIGYAWRDALGRLSAGVIRPAKASEPCACRRAHSMGRDVQELLDEQAAVELVLIERPPPTQGKRRSNPSAQHQAYGLIMGVLLGSTVPVEIVHPATWTKSTRKDARNAELVGRLGIDPAKDRGGDAADAIGILEWWEAGGRPTRPVKKRRRVKKVALAAADH